MTYAPGFTPRNENQRLVAFYDAAPNAEHHGVDQIPLRDAEQYLLPGPPLVGLVYVTHPRYSRKLVPYADYDEEVARDKLNEALRIVNRLGASDVTARTARGSSTTAGVSLEPKFAGIKIGGASIGGGKSAQWDVEYEHHGTGGPRMDPRPLLYPEEPGFLAACEAVLVNGARSIRIAITREFKFSVNSDVAAALKKAGFMLGAEAGKERSSMFVIEADFGEDPRKAARKPAPRR